MRIGAKRHRTKGGAIDVKFVASLVGERPIDEAKAVVERCAKYKDIIVAIGMATSEVGLEIAKLKPAF